MRRSSLIKAHLWVAAFFTPALLVIAYSGGMYLLGNKGQVVQQVINPAVNTRLDKESPSLKSDVQNMLSALGIEHSFEYVKVKGNVLYTRPTSRTHYELRLRGQDTSVTRNEPDLLAAIIELHKGHGPLWFKTFQKFMALGLLFVLLTGTWLGLSAKGLRKSTLASAGGGLVVFLLLVLAT